MHQDKTPPHIRLDERNHVEEPLLRQLETMPGLHWEVRRLEMGTGQLPSETSRESFDAVLMKREVLDALLRINPWMNEAQVFEAYADLTSFDGDNLAKNNGRILELLTKGTKVRTEGGPSEDAFYIDYKTPANNRFIAVSQMKFRVPGTDHHIYPDVVLFVNGIPVSVIECKSPKDKDPIPHAIDQLMRYAEGRDYVKEGNKALFYYNQFIIATCRSKAKFGTVTTSIEKHFYRWTSAYPQTLEEVASYCNPQATYFTNEEGSDDEGLAQELRTSPNDQQRLVHGMLKPENLLSIIRTFCVWTTTEEGQLIKVVGRHQQLRAVKKTVERLLTGKNRDERSGIIWHTQGSGKS